MGNYVISTDTTCDLEKEYLDERGIQLHPLHYLVNGVEYGLELENKQPTLKEFYGYLRDGVVPKTNATSIDYDIKLFEEAAKEGKNVIHFGLASVLSASCSNAMIAAKEVMEKYPGVKIEVIDSATGSSGLALLVDGAFKRLQDGMSFEDTVAWVKDAVGRTRVFFSVANLMTLYRGGRLKKSAAIFGTALKIQPTLRIFPDGTLGAIGKVRGRSKALEWLADTLQEYKKAGNLPSRVVIAHADSGRDAELLKAMVHERIGIEDVTILMVSPTLGAHVGPDAMILGFIEGE